MKSLDSIADKLIGGEVSLGEANEMVGEMKLNSWEVYVDEEDIGSLVGSGYSVVKRESLELNVDDDLKSKIDYSLVSFGNKKYFFKELF